MIYTLFVIMIMQDGTRIDHRYPDKMKYLECMSYARQEAEAMRHEDTSRFNSLDFYCGTEEDLKRDYPNGKQD